MHPVRPAVSAPLRSRGEPDAQPWELTVKDGKRGAVQVVVDQGQVQVPSPSGGGRRA